MCETMIDILTMQQLCIQALIITDRTDVRDIEDSVFISHARIKNSMSITRSRQMSFPTLYYFFYLNALEPL